jgi:hypothetical protein
MARRRETPSECAANPNDQQADERRSVMKLPSILQIICNKSCFSIS